MSNNQQPQSFIARYGGICPLCPKLIVKGVHMITRMSDPIKADNNYYGEEREYIYAHTHCYNESKGDDHDRARER